MSLNLVFTGKSLRISGGEKAFDYPAVSGSAGSFDPIPEGKYWVNSDEIYELNYFTDFRNKALWNLTEMFNSNSEDGGAVHQRMWGMYRIM